jgi:hypothetical protein
MEAKRGGGGYFGERLYVSVYVWGLSLLCAHRSLIVNLIKPAFNKISEEKYDMLFLSLLYSLASECCQLN